MEIIDGTTIIMTRGDSEWCQLPMYTVDEEGTETLYKLSEGESAYFSVKEDYDDEEPVIKKKLGDDYTLHISSRDTEGLPFGTLYYDAYIMDEDGERTTYIKKAKLKLDKEAHT